MLHKDEYQGDDEMGIKVSARCEENALKSIKEIGTPKGEEVDIIAQESAVDKFYGMMKISKKLADEIIDMEMWDCFYLSSSLVKEYS
jgi:hypothetical protein